MSAMVKRLEIGMELDERAQRYTTQRHQAQAIRPNYVALEDKKQTGQSEPACAKGA